MNSARIELVQDDAETAPRLSRVMPAILDQLVTETAFNDFCNTIDAILPMVAANYRDHSTRLIWWYCWMAVWFVWLYGIYISSTLQKSHRDSENTVDDRFYIAFSISTVVCVIHMGVTWIWMQRSNVATRMAELIREIRYECEAMSKRTPNVSFHLVLLLSPRSYTSASNPIGRINVSVSTTGTAIGKITKATAAGTITNDSQKTGESSSVGIPHPETNVTSAVTNDYQQLLEVDCNNNVPQFGAGRKLRAVRLEIIADGPDESPQISRSIPAALDDRINVNDTSFQIFCNQLEGLLGMLNIDYQRRKKRSTQLYCGIFFIWLLSHWNSIRSPTDVDTMFWLVTWLMLSICIYLAIVWFYTSYLLRNPKSAKEIIQEIQSVCEAMTNHTPQVFFHPVILSVQGADGLMDTIDHIDIIFSADSDAAIATSDVVSYIDTHKSVINRPLVVTKNDDYQQLDIPRFNVIQDNRETAPLLHRVMPTILRNIVPETSFIEFCDTIDALLALNAADNMCRARRKLWWYRSQLIWFLWFSGIYLIVIFETSSSVQDVLYIVFVTSLIVCIIQLGAIWIWTTFPTEVTSDVLREIRTECEAMTNCTPHASFHVVLIPIATALLGQKLTMNMIERIDVSVSATGMEIAQTPLNTAARSMVRNETLNATGTSGGTIGDISHPTLNVTSDYQQLENVV